MRILLITLGSHGDVHPFVGLALALKRRGHQVTVMTSGYFGDLIRSTGLDFVELGSREEFASMTDNPDLWNPRKSFGVIARSISNYLPRMYERIVEFMKAHPDAVMVGSTLAFAARLVQEKFETPLITVHLSPSTIRSVHDMMKIPGVPLGAKSPVWLKRAFFALVDWAALDRHLGPGINGFRKQIGLPSVKRIVAEWWHSPLGVIGLWPEFFAPPQLDWPRQTVLTGFPLWDEAGVTGISEEMENFLSGGPPPVAFTPGSAMMHGEKFFEKAIEACKIADVRGILLSRHVRHIPKNLPAGVAHFEYAPFSQLLPRCAILVHHGGIGTTAQGLASGRPQIVTPFSFDQFDNAERSRKLGAAYPLVGKKFTASNLASAIQRVQQWADAGNLAAIAAKIQQQNTLDETSARIEALAGPLCAYH
jgi:rhamnosyltransferase subunit B